MKIYLLIAFVLTAPNLIAQEYQPDLDKLIAKSKLSILKNDSFKVAPKPFVCNKQKPAPGVYGLPQDGMPCIVPDTNSTAAMPNAAKQNPVPYANRIPNAIQEQRLLPKQKMDSK